MAWCVNVQRGLQDRPCQAHSIQNNWGQKFARCADLFHQRYIIGPRSEGGRRELQWPETKLNEKQDEIVGLTGCPGLDDTVLRLIPPGLANSVRAPCDFSAWLVRRCLLVLLFSRYLVSPFSRHVVVSPPSVHIEPTPAVHPARHSAATCASGCHQLAEKQRGRPRRSTAWRYFPAEPDPTIRRHDCSGGLLQGLAQQA